MASKYTLVSREGVLTTIMWENNTPVLHHLRRIPSFVTDVNTRPYKAFSWSEAFNLKQKLLEYGYDYQIVPYFDEAIAEAIKASELASKVPDNLFSRLNFLRLLWIRSGHVTS